MESPIATASFPVVVANADDNADVTNTAAKRNAHDHKI